MQDVARAAQTRVEQFQRVVGVAGVDRKLAVDRFRLANFQRARCGNRIVGQGQYATPAGDLLLGVENALPLLLDRPDAAVVDHVGRDTHDDLPVRSLNGRC